MLTSVRNSKLEANRGEAMAKEVRRKSRKDAGKELRKELKNELLGIFLVALGLFAGFCLWQGTGKNDLNTLGAVGSFIYRVISTLFGNGKYALPLIFIGLGISRLWFRTAWDSITLTAWTALYLSFLAMLHLSQPIAAQTLAVGWSGLGGGVCGAMLARLTLTLFGQVGSYIFLSASMLISIIVIARRSLRDLIRPLAANIGAMMVKTRENIAGYIIDKENDTEEEEAPAPPVTHKSQRPEESNSITPLIIDHMNKPTPVRGNLRLVKNSDSEKPDSSNTLQAGPSHIEAVQPVTAQTGTAPAGAVTPGNEYILPSLELLQFPTKLKSQRLNKDITDNIRILEETLDNFGVKAKVTQVSRGPSITRYEIQPPPGIKVSRIVNLADDIALSLAAPQVRIEAPIPGKAAVGIEVPNEEIATVSLREVLETPLFQDSSSKLAVALGKDIAGNPIVADLAKMPHLLVAGATGSGKSVCMNSIISSILFRALPHEVKLLMIDPKVVELTNYNGIPHLISPVVTDAKKAATALRWAVHEMENRYELFAGLGVKDIGRYQKAKKTEDPEGCFPDLPYIVVLIDELADLMMVAPADVEDAICRLAQMARAAGIHLVVATQRPSVDVITGLIKANIPSRIAFAVSSQTDSRTILDMGGAERLLGRGDMLFYPTGMAKPIRVQGVYVSDQELESLAEFLKSQKPAQYDTPWTSNEQESQEQSIDDELVPDAARIFIESGQASISLLQRRLRIGYTRAARIIDQLEVKGIVGGYEGSKPRAIRMTWEEYERTFGGGKTWTS